MFYHYTAIGIASFNFGGLLLGFAVGWVASHLVRRVDDRLILITITVAVAYGMYLLGTALHTSGLLAVVGAGLVNAYFAIILRQLFGLLGAVIGRLLMINVFIPLQNVLARWWRRRTPEWHTLS